MPKPYPQEFRDDVVNVARRREGGQTIKHPSSPCCRTTSSTAAAGHPTGPEDRRRDLDRADLPPPPTPGRLGRLTPIEYETIMTTPALQAA